jgi:drug/metabolite transporter (DMT)-like permease
MLATVFSVPVLLALLAAVGYGVSDYLSGVFSRRLRFLDVLTVGYTAGLLAFVVAWPLFEGTFFATRDLVWGAIAGFAGAAGVLLLMHAFRVGRFAVASPVSAVGTAAIPVAVGLLLGEQPGSVRMVGLAVGVVAIWLVSGAGVGRRARSAGPRTADGFWSALGAGVAFAAMFLALSRSDYASGPWPVLALQLGMLAVFACALAGRRHLPRVRRADLAGVALVGISAVVGNLAFVYSARLGLISVAAVIASMAPAVTVILARVHTGERFSPRQLVGLGHAGVALVLIGAGSELLA